MSDYSTPRIGNIYRFPDREEALTVLTDTEAGYWDTVRWPREQITPVPILVQWLERLGFSRHPPGAQSPIQTAVFFHTGSRQYGVGYHEDAVRIFSNVDSSEDPAIPNATPTDVTIRYVHELQNFWMDTTGEQLTAL